jgi:hypothetical protein
MPAPPEPTSAGEVWTGTLIASQIPMSSTRGLLFASAVALAIVSSPAGGDGSVAPVQIEMKNVRLHTPGGVTLDVRDLRGSMISRWLGAPPVFDNQESYVLHLSSANISMDMDSLANLLNRHVLAYEGAPLKDVTVKPAGDRLELKGTLHKGIDVPFSSKASVSATADGRMRLHVESMKAIGIPTKGLMDIFGLELDSLVRLREGRGVVVEDNDIYVAPGDALPPPVIRGRLRRVAIVGDRLVQTFVSADGRRATALHPPSPHAPNYIYFGGGNIVFGKLTMKGADLQLIDQDPRDAFDFSPAEYNTQLVAGYSKNTPQRGLKTYMPDLNDLRRPAPSTRTARRP